MATNKLFTVAGVSLFNGEYKVRFANDAMRVKVLYATGHSDIVMIELPNPMTKIDAIKFCQSLEEFSGVNAQMAISDYLAKYDVQPKVKKAKVVKKVETELEDEPF